MPEAGLVVLLLAAGFAGGLAAGLFGIGGGIIYVLVYEIYLQRTLAGLLTGDQLVQLIILNAAVSIFASALMGSFRQYRHGAFHARQVLQVGLAGVVSAFLTTKILAGWPAYDKRAFLAVFTIALIPLIWKFMPRNRQPVERPVPRLAFPLAGFLAGAGSALSGLGGGFIINPLLHGYFGYPLKRTFSVSLGSMLLTTLGIIAYHLLNSAQSFTGLPVAHYRGVLFPMVLPVVAGVFLGTPLGIRWHHRFPPRLLGGLFFLLALAIAVRNLVLIFR